jgi:hypothetical protein
VLGHSLRPWQRAAKKVDLRDIEVHTPPFGVPHLLGRDLAHRRVRIERHENERRRAVTRVLSLRRAAENSVATIQSRLTGTSPGQLSLPAARSGELSLADDDPRGRVSLAAEPAQDAE